MAGVLDEFDDATPLKGTYCAQMTEEEFEEQGSSCTERALAELLDHLDANPEVYRKVMRSKKKQEAEEGGLLSFMKVKLWGLWYEDGGCTVSDSECEEQMEKLKDNMMKAFDYAEECKGRRYSKRLAEKRRAKQKSICTPSRTREAENVPPTPPPPPPITPHMKTPLTRRPLTERRGTANTRSQQPQQTLSSSADSEAYKRILQQLKGSGGRRNLRTTSERSPGGTPIAGWPKGRCQADMLPFFNARLMEKFKNAQSPIPSPTFQMASPGNFDSPL